MRHSEFPCCDNLIYLNHAAVAPWPLRTSLAVKKFADQNSQYGAYHYPDWLKKESELRDQLRLLLNAKSAEDIALVKNTSEAISFVAYGLDWHQGDNIVSSNEEFPSNRVPWQSLENQGVEFRQADLSNSPAPETALFSQVDQHTRMITVSSVQFASGLRLNLEKIGQFCKQHDILFCIDAIQSLGALSFDVQMNQADFVMADGHKWMCGPEGIGVFYTHKLSREKLKLTQYGWHMLKNANNYENRPWEVHSGARRFECGSPNMLGIHALSASLSLLLETGIGQIEEKVQAHSEFIKKAILSNPNLQLLSQHSREMSSGIVLFRHNTLANSDIHQHLSSNGIVCAARGQGIRLSPHFYHTEEEITKVTNLLLKI